MSLIDLPDSDKNAYTEDGVQQILFSPFPKQAMFLASEVDEVLFGGARGSGKTQALIIDAALKPRKWHYEGNQLDMKPVVDKYSIDYPEYRAIIIRRRYDDLIKNFIPEAQKIYSKLGAVWREKPKSFTFPSGAKIFMAYCDCRADVDKYIGGNYHYLGVEELNQFPESWIRDLGGSVRSVNPELKPYKRYTTNPGGVGHLWIKRKFIDKCPPKIGKEHFEEKFNLSWNELIRSPPVQDEEGNTIQYIPALVFENPVLVKQDPRYVRYLKSLDETKRRMWLFGDWDVMGGAFFEEFSAFHHIIDARDFNLDTYTGRVYRVVDYGTTNPFAVAFFVVDVDGYVTVFDEIYETGLVQSEQARRIKEKTSRWGLTEDDIYATIVDPSMKVKSHEYLNTLHSSLDIYIENGIEHIVLGNNDRVQGWATFREYLKVPEEGRPYLVFTSNCKNCIETIPSLVRSDKNPEDVNTEGEDHLADALRYGLMYIDRPRPRAKEPDVPNWQKRLFGKKPKSSFNINNVWAG